MRLTTTSPVEPPICAPTNGSPVASAVGGGAAAGGSRDLLLGTLAAMIASVLTIVGVATATGWLDQSLGSGAALAMSPASSGVQLTPATTATLALADALAASVSISSVPRVPADRLAAGPPAWSEPLVPASASPGRLMTWDTSPSLAAPEEAEMVGPTSPVPSGSSRPARVANPVLGRSAPTYVGFVLDGSGSMRERAENGSTKLDQAKRVVTDAVADLPTGAYGSVRLFGHRVPESDKLRSCQDSELVVPFMPGPAAGEQLGRTPITARGWTPLATNLRLAGRELPTGANHVLVLVSDGKETCGGDPVATARELRAADPGLQIYTVGFAADAGARSELGEIARVGGGVYEDAVDKAGLVAALKRIGELANTRY